jgi:excisionase family DNA binding protein
MITLEDIAKRLDKLEMLTALSSKDVLDIKDTSMLTGYSVKYLRLLISQRNIPYYRRGNRLYFNRAEVEDWMMGERIPTQEEMNIKAMGYRSS